MIRSLISVAVFLVATSVKGDEVEQLVSSLEGERFADSAVVASLLENEHLLTTEGRFGPKLVELADSVPVFVMIDTLTQCSRAQLFEGLAQAVLFSTPGLPSLFLIVRDNALDLSRFDAAPLIAFTATKETDYGIETDGRIPR